MLMGLLTKTILCFFTTLISQKIPSSHTKTSVADFRVEKQDIPRLADALGIPPVIKCQQRSVCDGTEGLCMLLRRFAYPCRLSDMIARFGRPVPVISMITKEVMNLIYNNHQQRLTQWNQFLLSPASLQEYANAIHRDGAALDNCFGFIDGTVRAISRPGKDQRLVYNGHKRVHALKFQSVSLPNGIIANLFGPVGKSESLLTYLSYLKCCYITPLCRHQ